MPHENSMIKQQMFYSSYPGTENENRIKKKNHGYIHKPEVLCCCQRRRAFSCDVRGNEVGCITGFRNKQTIQIVELRGSRTSQTETQASYCPVHNHSNNDNEEGQTDLKSAMESEPRIAYKEVIVIWNNAVEHTKEGRWEDAFNTLQEIQNYSAQMRFNLGQIAWALDRPDLAKQNFMAAIEKDPHMALAHFQLGMVNYRLQRYNESRGSYDKAKNCLRGNKFIDYRQLGFIHKLYECEVQYNLALTYATMMNNSEYALELLQDANRVAIETRHGPMIEKAQQQLLRNELYNPYVLPGNELFRPPKSKVQNLENIDYLGKSKVVSQLHKPETSSNNNNKDDLRLPAKGTFRPIEDDFSDDDASYSTSSSPTPSMVAKMTHKDTLATWHEAVVAFDKGNVQEALGQLSEIIDPSAKILYSIGVLQRSVGQLEDALATFKEVVSKDPHLAIGHFQHGLVLGQLDQLGEAWEAFSQTQKALRGNKLIDYKQLGLQYKLHKCEVLHNEAWTYNEQNQRDWAQKLLDEAMACKADPRHDKLDESYKHFTNGYSFVLFEPPKAVLFRPPKSKIDNLERKDYLGKAKIVSKLPSQRGGSSTPPPPSSNTLKVSMLPPRSRTPTPASSGQRAPPPSTQSPSLSRRPLPVPSPPGQARSLTPTVTIEVARSPSPGPPRRPPPPRSPGSDVTDGKNTPPPLRPVPSPSRTSPVPTRPVPQRPLSIAQTSQKLGADLPPSRTLPSPNRASPVQERPLPQRPVPDNILGQQRSDSPPTRSLPSPNRSSPVPNRPVPGAPQQSSSPELPEREVPLPPRNSMLEVPDMFLQPLPNPGSPDLPKRPLPVFPGVEKGNNLSNSPIPPKPVSGASDVQGRSLPPSPGRDETFAPKAKPTRTQSMDIPPDLPSRPPQISSKISSPNLTKRPLPPVVQEETPDDLPSRPPPMSPRISSPNLIKRPLPPVVQEGSPNDLRFRPVPLVPRTSNSDSDLASPELPTRPVSKIMLTSSALPSSPDDLACRPVPPSPASANSKEPSLPPRPNLSKPLKLTQGSSAAPYLPERPIPSVTLPHSERRSSSPGLPDLPPPPPPPKKGSSPLVPRKQGGNGGRDGGNQNTMGHKGKLVKILTDSPPVLRKAANVTVQKKEGPAIPAKSGNSTASSKPAPAENKPSPARNKPSPDGNKSLPAGNKPPIQAFRPQPKPGGGQGGKKRTALVIATHEANAEGQVSVAEGDLITITHEDGDWLQVEVKGEKGQIPRTCVKSLKKPGIQLNFS